MSVELIYNTDATNFVYQIIGGLDYTIVPHLDFRAVEIAVGKVSTGIVTAPTNKSTMVTVSSGIAFHF